MNWSNAPPSFVILFAGACRMKDTSSLEASQFCCHKLKLSIKLERKEKNELEKTKTIIITEMLSVIIIAGKSVYGSS